MAKLCCFCGKSLGATEQFTRMINGQGYTVCQDCAFGYDRFKLRKPEIHEKTIPWYERVIADPNVAKDLKETLKAQNVNLNCNAVSDDKETEYTKGSLSYTHTAQMNVNNSPDNQSSWSIWISVIEAVSGIMMIAETVLGVITGYSLGNAGDYLFGSSTSGIVGGTVLGGLLGLLIGILSSSVLMTFAGIAEDVKASRILAEQSDKHLAEIEKILKEKK